MVDSPQALGRHLLADFYDCASPLLADPIWVEQTLLRAADAGHATVLNRHFHHFGPGLGVTGVLLLKESHISIHTWPESGFAALDLFMCGASDADAALAVLLEAFAPARQSTQAIIRGLVPPR